MILKQKKSQMLTLQVYRLQFDNIFNFFFLYFSSCMVGRGRFEMLQHCPTLFVFGQTILGLLAVPENQISSVLCKLKPDLVHRCPLCFTKAPSTYHELVYEFYLRFLKSLNVQPSIGKNNHQFDEISNISLFGIR